MLSKKLFSLKNSTFACLVLLASCGEKDTTDTRKTDTTTKTTQEVKKNVEDAVKNLPRVNELPDLLAAAGVDDFYEKLPNPAKNVDRYLTTNDFAAISLGMYVVDLGYVLNYDKMQLGIDYIQSCKKIADKLGVSSAIDDQSMERFRKNINKKDTLIQIANDAVKNIDKYLVSNDRTALSAVILGGMYLEGLHLSTNIIAAPTDMDKTTKDMVFGRMIKIVSDQEKSLDDAIASLNAVKRDPKGDELLSGLQEIKKVYTDNRYSEKFAKFKGGEKIPVSSEDLKPLLMKVKEVRDRFIQ